MSWSLFLTGVAPLILFVLVDLYLGMTKAILAAILSGFGMLAFSYFVLGEFDISNLFELFFIVALGLTSIKLKNPLFFKFQPVVIGLGLGLFLGWFQLFDVPYLLKLGARTAKLLPQFTSILASSQMRQLLATLSWQMIVLFWVHALLVGFAALRLKNLGWLLMRLAIYPFIFFLILGNLLLFPPSS